jgi:hypothetical protein
VKNLPRLLRNGNWEVNEMAVMLDSLPLSEHARQRMHQRAIKPWMVEVALGFGEKLHDGNGCIRHIVTDRVLENTPYEPFKEKLRGLCVVVSIADGTIVTVEWLYKLRSKAPKRFSMRRSVKNFRWF